MRELKIGTSWVRGVVGESFTPELVVNFASAFGTWTEGGPVVIGRDTRPSSRMFREAVVAGLLASGSEVIDLGVCSTPFVSFAVRELGCSGGLAITGSHNDSEWNALKFVGPDGVLLNPVRSEELLDIYHAHAFRTFETRPTPPHPAPEELHERYLDQLLSCLDVELIRSRNFRVAFDFCGGAVVDPAEYFAAGLNLGLVALHREFAGRFPHPPAPTARNMSALADLVSEQKVDLGVGLNVDGDRLGFVTETGKALSEEMTLPLVALSRLRRRPGLTVTNLSTSSRVDAVATLFGQSVLRTAVGETFVIDRGLEEDAVLAGEGSGGTAPLPVTMTFDALLSLGFVLEEMARDRVTLSQLAEKVPSRFMRKGEIRCEPARAYRTLERFESEFADAMVRTDDGIRFDWEGAWLHARVSNTEPLIRVIVEAEERNVAEELFQRGIALARRQTEQ